MNIGIIGTGSIGATLAKKLAAAGHQVKVTNTREPDELAQKARELGASPASLNEVVQGVDVVFISVPFSAIAKLPAGLLRAVPADVVVVDTGNYYPFRDGDLAALTNQPESEWVAAQLGRPVLKAINNLLAATLADFGTPPGMPGRIALSIAGDDIRAKQVMTELANDLGFDAVDAGSLAESWRQQPGTPAYCTELTAPELMQALADAVPGTAPAIRDQIMSQLMQRTALPSHEDVVALNRSVRPVNPKQD